MNHSSSIRIGFAAICVAALGSAGLFAQNYSSLVYPGTDGKLVYAGYANQGQTSTGNKMVDFSHAGYMGGGVAIPWVPVAITLDPVTGTGDDYSRIQAAINTLSAMPLSAAGFRGTLLLRAGTYRVSQTLNINASGIVIRGEGQHSGGTVIQFTATVQDDLFEFSSSNGFWSKIAGTERAITDSVVPTGTRSFNVASTSGYSVGDKLMVHRTPNDFWIQEIKMDQLQALAYANNASNAASVVDWTAASYKSLTPRVITAIVGNTITVDAPLVHAIETQYGSGEVYRYQNDNALRNVGIERIRMESAYVSETDENHGWNAVKFYQAENCWARQVTARYFGYSCVNIGYRCLFITVEDCAQLDPKSIVDGGRRYSFNIDRAAFILMQRNYVRDGRHDFVTGDQTRGPIVFADSLTENCNEDIGPHQRYAEGLLYDNIHGRMKPGGNTNGGSMNIQNRNWSGTGHGWAGAQTVFWNCDTDRYMIVDSPKGAMNFSIGNVYAEQRSSRWGPAEPEGIWQSRNLPVNPRSLYYTQLRDRLGYQAMATVTTPSQLQGTIWSSLATWKGDSAAPGLPAFTPLRIDVGLDLVSDSATHELNAIIRYPLPGNFPMTRAWTQLSGPATANFANAASATTTVTLPAPGVYEFRFTASQNDNRDTANIVPYSASDTIRVTLTEPYIVTFSANGGTSAAPANKVVTYGSTYGTLAMTTRSGHSFKGWFTAATGGNLVTSATVVSTTSNHMLYAQWNTLPSVNAGPDQTVAMGEGSLWTPAVVPTLAWYDAADAGSITTVSSAVSQWNDKSGNVRHATQGTALNRPVYVANDPMVNNLPSIGNIAASGSIGLITPSMSAKNVYVVTYYKDGVDNAFDGYSTLFSGAGVNGTYRVMGNQLTADFIASSQFNDAGTFKNGSTTSSITALPAGASLFKFKSSAARTQVYSLGFNALAADRDWQGSYSEWIFTDGTEDLATQQKIEGYLAHKWGLAAKLPADHPYKSTAPTTSGAMASLNGTASDAENDPLTTNWSVTSGPAPVTYNNASAVDTTADFTMAGTYTLRLTANDGSGLSYDECVITVEAVSTYTLSYDANEATAGTAPASQIKTRDVNLTLATNSGGLARTGYTFAGWNTAANGSGTDYAAGEIYMANASVTLFAKWIINTYTVIFDANGGTAPNPSTKSVTYGSTYGNLATTSRSGHTFKGWFTAASGGTQVTDTTSVSAAAIHTLYAQWTSATTAAAAAKHFIRGETEDTVNNPAGYYQTPAGTIGTSGSAGSRTDQNVVFGFTLPTLAVGATLDSATFNFEITGARDSTGGQNLPELHAYLLSSADPTITGANLFYHGAQDPSANGKRIGTTSVTIDSGVTTQLTYTAGQQPRSFTLTGEALTLLKSFYNGHTPTRSTVYFRFNMSVDPAVTTFRRYAVNTATDGSSLQLVSIAPPNRAPTWTNNPITKPAATEGQPYSGTLTGAATDLDGQALTFAKVSGPTWLNVAANGTLSGTPSSSNIGTVSFVVSVSDGVAAPVEANLNISVQTAFESWVIDGAGQGVTFNGDANNDGVVDGLAWLLGAAQPAATANALVPAGGEVDQGKLTIGFDCLKASKRGTATLTLQHSNSLAANSWTSVQIPETSGTVGGVVFTIAPIDGSNLKQVQATVPASVAGGSGKVFVRLSAEIQAP